VHAGSGILREYELPLDFAGPTRRITCANEKQKPNGHVSLSQRWDRMMERLARC
jgi:hypothetical protein